MKLIEDLPVRLSSKINVQTDGCWLWTAYCAPNGYGICWLNAPGKLAHRVVYQLLVGPIPPGLDIDHLCRVRNCVNPHHLEPVTRRENLRRGVGVSSAMTHCRRGHPFDEDNTYWIDATRRQCRACKRERQRRSYWETRS